MSTHSRAALLVMAMFVALPPEARAQGALRMTVELGSPAELQVDIRYYDPSDVFERLRGSRMLPVWVTVTNVSPRSVTANYRDFILGIGDASRIVSLHPIDPQDVPAEFRRAAGLGGVLGALTAQGADWGANPFSRRFPDSSLAAGRSRSGFLFFLRPENVAFTGFMAFGTIAHPFELLSTTAVSVTTKVATRSAATLLKDVINSLGRIVYGPPPFGKSYAVLFGVSAYDARNNLPWVTRDLARMSQFLQQQGFDRVIVVSNKNVTADTLRNIQGQLQVSLGPEDRLLVYYSGHGTRARQTGYLVLSESAGSTINPRTDIPMVEFISWMRAQTVKQLLVILDACYSGSAAGRETRDAGTLLASVDQAALYQLSSERGRFLMMAGTESQLAHEGKQWDGGLFTNAILSGLQDNRVSSTGDRIITTYELFARAKRRVLEEVKENSLDDQVPLLQDLDESSKGEFVFVRAN